MTPPPVQTESPPPVPKSNPAGQAPPHPAALAQGAAAYEAGKKVFLAFETPERLMLGGAVAGIVLALFPWGHATVASKLMNHSETTWGGWRAVVDMITMAFVALSLVKPELAARVVPLAKHVRARFTACVTAVVATLFWTMVAVSEGHDASKAFESAKAFDPTFDISAGPTMWAWLAVIASVVAGYGAFQRLQEARQPR